MHRRQAVGLLLAGALATPLDVRAQDHRLFRIGTGGPGGIYFALGGTLADALSSPPGTRPCRIEEGGCGIPGMVAVAQSTAGSVANVEGLLKGSIESAFVQSDVAAAAFAARGAFVGRAPATRLRLIASLYPEALHLVALPEAGIATVPDLRGKRVALDEPGSGTLVDARLVLEAFGLMDGDLLPFYVKHGPALVMLRQGELDAMFVVGGEPMPAVQEAVAGLGAVIVPIDGPEVAALLRRERFFTTLTIRPETYGLPDPVATIAVTAQWLVTDAIPDELGFGLARVLFDPETLTRLAERHPQGGRIALETALLGASVPLHRGAERFYRQHGLLNAE